MTYSCGVEVCHVIYLLPLIRCYVVISLRETVERSKRLWFFKSLSEYMPLTRKGQVVIIYNRRYYLR